FRREEPVLSWGALLRKQLARWSTCRHRSAPEEQPPRSQAQQWSRPVWRSSRRSRLSRLVTRAQPYVLVPSTASAVTGTDGGELPLPDASAGSTSWVPR